MMLVLSGLIMAFGVIVLSLSFLLFSVWEEDDLSPEESTSLELANSLYPPAFLLYVVLLIKKKPKSAYGVIIGVVLLAVGFYLMRKIAS